MFDGSLMLRVNWPVVDTIYPQSNKFATGVKIKATGELKLNDRLAYDTSGQTCSLNLCDKIHLLTNSSSMSFNG